VRLRCGVDPSAASISHPPRFLPRESITTSLRRASTVKVERRRASNTFTARSEPHNRGTIHAWRYIAPCDQLPTVMICAPAAKRPGFRMGVWGGRPRAPRGRRR
jgi:hypothetical protein